MKRGTAHRYVYLSDLYLEVPDSNISIGMEKQGDRLLVLVLGYVSSECCDSIVCL